jgi:hypothetical protein
MRDWIGQYLMWDFSNGRFRKPTVPLYSWEELGKMDSNLLKRMRHIEFSQFAPSADGAFYVDEKDGNYPMEKTELTDYDDIPDNPYLLVNNDHLEPIIDEEKLPQVIKDEAIHGDVQDILEEDKINLATATLTELLSLHSMEEEMALQIHDMVENGKISTFNDLETLSFIEPIHMKMWKNSFKA